MDDDLLDVGDDKQRRVLERLAVLEQLLIGLVEIGVRAFVLPGEEALLPDIRPARPPRCLSAPSSNARLPSRFSPGVS